MTKENYYRKLITTYRSSGLTQMQFCKAENISLSSFKSWIKKINHIDNSPAFVAIQKEQILTKNLEIIYPNGVKICLENDSDFSLISKLIHC